MPTPKTQLEMAEADRQKIVLEVQEIQAQLGDRQRTDDTGNRIPAAEYWKWKRAAQHTLTCRLGDLRAAKSKVRTLRDEEWNSRPVPASQDADLVVKSLLEILDAFAEEDFDSGEKEAIASAKSYLARGGD